MNDFVAKVKEIGLRDFSISDISKQDLDSFSASIQEIQDLFSNFPNSYTRKQIAQEILGKIKPIETFLWIVGNELKSVNNMCESLEDVSDIELAMNLIVKLANTETTDYIFKKFYVADLTFQETRHGDREHSLARGTVCVIGKKDVIESIEDKEYVGSELASQLTNMAISGYELIVCTDHYYKNNVLPWHYSVTLEMFQIRTAGLTSEIKCYVHDGPLQDAVTLLRSYITQNGGNISGLSEDKLIELIRNC